MFCKSHFILAYIFAAAQTFSIAFSKSTYHGTVSTLEDPIGAIVINTELLYNRNLVKSFTVKDYNLYRTDGSYFAVNKNGIVTLKKVLPYRRVYNFQISMLYTVFLKNSRLPRSGFLTANARVQGIGMAKLFIWY